MNQKPAPTAPDRPDSIWAKLARYSFFAAWVGAACLFLAHVYFLIFHHAPVLRPTTGTEEEDLFSVWKFTQGQAVYNDPLQIPYSASLYNWAFYMFYGIATKFAMTALHLDAIWLPTVCRLLTLALGLVACGLFYLALRQGDHLWRFWPRALLVILCFSPVCGPLAGNWPFSTRPDIGALTFELTGLVLAMWYLKTKRLLLPVLAALAFYLAWSFKQSSLSALSGVCLSLLLLRNWKALFLIVGIWVSLVALTLVLGGALYRYDSLATQSHCPILFSHWLKYSTWAASKNPFIPMAILIMGYLAVRMRSSLFRSPVEMMLLITSLLALLLALVTVGKLGSDTNYFIPFATWSLLWLIFVADRVPARFFQVNLLLFSSLLIVKLAFIFGSGIEVPSPDPFKDLAARLASLPGPTFVNQRTGNLPWIQTKAPYFVINYTYPFESDLGIKHAHDGWEGLMKDGYFNTVVVARSDDYPVSPDLLDRYTLTSQDENYRYYRRKP